MADQIHRHCYKASQPARDMEAALEEKVRRVEQTLKDARAELEQAKREAERARWQAYHAYMETAEGKAAREREWAFQERLAATPSDHADYGN